MKKALSEEALKALFTEEEKTNASEGANAEGNINTETLTEEEIAAAAALKKEEEAAAAAAAAEETDENELATMLQAELDETKNLHAQEISDLEVAATELAETNQKQVDSLKEIIVGQIAKMRIALNFAAVDMSILEVSAVVTEYKSTMKSFMKSLPVGSLTEKDDGTTETPVASSLDASKLKALGITKK
jgi:hypothetical protein